MERTKKFLAVVLALVLSISLLPTTGVSAASKKVKLNKTKATIYVGKTVTLKLKNNKKKVKWSTSNKKVATVTKKGKVKGKKAGKATITAKVGKKKYKCKITVKKKATPKPTTKPTEQPTTKPVEQPTTKPVEQPTTKPSTDKYADWEFKENETGVSITGYKGNDTDIVIPSEINGKRVTSIGVWAFKGCSSLTSVVIPESVIEIENSAFYGCYIQKEKFINNSALNAEEANYWGATLYDEITNGLYIRNNTVIGIIDKEVTEVVIPEGVTDIGSGAFNYCGNLISITIPESVTGPMDDDVPPIYIGSWGCYNLSTIKGKAGSYAEKLAKANGYTFIAE